MLISPFRVRLADDTTGLNFRPGIVGTVVGEDTINGPKGPQKIYSVLWFNVDEETGDETVSDQAAPTGHLPTELRAHVDPEEWATDEDWDDDEEGIDTDTTGGPHLNA